MSAPAGLDPFISPADLDYSPDDKVAWATARIREYCRWHIYPSITETRTERGRGGPTVMLPTMHMTALGAVVQHLWDGSAFTDVTIASGMLGFDEAGIITRRDAVSWPINPSTVTLTFTHGYDTVPDGLRSVAVNIATRYGRQMTGATLESAGAVQVRYETTPFTADEQVILDAYRLPFRP